MRRRFPKGLLFQVSFVVTSSIVIISDVAARSGATGRKANGQGRVGYPTAVNKQENFKF